MAAGLWYSRERRCGKDKKQVNVAHTAAPHQPLHPAGKDISPRRSFVMRNFNRTPACPSTTVPILVQTSFSHSTRSPRVDGRLHAPMEQRSCPMAQATIILRQPVHRYLVNCSAKQNSSNAHCCCYSVCFSDKNYDTPWHPAKRFHSPVPSESVWCRRRGSNPHALSSEGF